MYLINLKYRSSFLEESPIKKNQGKSQLEDFKLKVIALQQLK